MDDSSDPDGLADVLYYSSDYSDGSQALNKIFAESDYVVCAAPLTPNTFHMIGKEQFSCMKQDGVFINVGRGPIVDEQAMIDALSLPIKERRLKGIALDVFETEPLPDSSPLWKMKPSQVLLSPHNMDQTDTFMHEATEFFLTENLPRFVRNLPVLNKVNPAEGY